jgi:hypothetical protein
MQLVDQGPATKTKQTQAEQGWNQTGNPLQPLGKGVTEELYPQVVLQAIAPRPLAM